MTNCGALVSERWKVVLSEGLEFLDGKRIKEVQDNEHKYLGILEISIPIASKTSTIYIWYNDLSE